MKIKSQKDFWSGLMFLAVGLAFAWGATFYSFGTSARPGPGYFPLGLGLLLAALGALVLFEALTIETEDGEPIGAFAWKPLCTILLAVLLFGLLLPRLGMVLTIPHAGDHRQLRRRRVPLARRHRSAPWCWRSVRGSSSSSGSSW